jgi:transposase
MAVAHSLVIIIYHMLKEKQVYAELRSRYVDEKEQEAAKRRAIRRLEQLGYSVTLHEAEGA